jgi:phage-related protein
VGLALPATEFGRAEFYIDLLADRGPLLDQPYTRQLRGKLRELRFYLGATGQAVRLSYYMAGGLRIILLTVFRKQRRRERAEIERAYKAMRRCIEEKHVTEEDSEETA